MIVDTNSLLKTTNFIPIIMKNPVHGNVNTIRIVEWV